MAPKLTIRTRLTDAPFYSADNISSTATAGGGPGSRGGLEPIIELPAAATAGRSGPGWEGERRVGLDPRLGPGDGIGNNTIIISGPDPPRATTPAPQRRNHPVLALLSVTLLFLASSFGVAVSVVVQQLGLQTDGDGAARLVLFIASCAGVLYVLLHLIAARRGTPRYYGSPQIYGEYLYSLALLLLRLGIPVWIAAVVLTALRAAKQGFVDLENRFDGNVVWWNLLASILAL
jgi:hypothetical protein